jgi:hypothetical protein
MISTVLALALAAAGPSPDALVRARKAYSACLGGFMKKSVADKLAVDAFAAALTPACAAQEQAFRSAVVASDTAAGIKRASAEANAASEIQDMIANTKDSFEGYSAPAKPQS